MHLILYTLERQLTLSNYSFNLLSAKWISMLNQPFTQHNKPYAKYWERRNVIILIFFFRNNQACAILWLKIFIYLEADSFSLVLKCLDTSKMNVKIQILKENSLTLKKSNTLLYTRTYIVCTSSSITIQWTFLLSF